MINLHLTKITKLFDLENLELYGTAGGASVTAPGGVFPLSSMPTSPMGVHACDNYDWTFSSALVGHARGSPN